MTFLKIHLRGWGLATISFIGYKMAQNTLGRSCVACFETILETNKITPTHTLILL